MNREWSEFDPFDVDAFKSAVELLAEISESEQRVMELVGEIGALLDGQPA